jgi:5-methyltetrahydrofolate--homocysteine methyltransferase
MQTKTILDLMKDMIVIFDGAMGTMLMAAGLNSGDIPELWNIEKPDIVMNIHQQYYNAGAHVVHTNTFGGTALKLQLKGHSDKMEAINTAAVKLARTVCPKDAFVAGDLGPSGKMLKPLGDTEFETLEETFYLQAAALLKGGADLISIETMFSLDEAVAALRGAKRAGDCPVIAATTYNKTPNGFFTIMGESVEQCVAAFEKEGADVIASNCTLGSRDMIDLTKVMRDLTSKPILLQPNAGKPVQQAGGVIYKQTAAEFADDIRQIIRAGANMVGGCCGTNADFIKAMVKTVG